MNRPPQKADRWWSQHESSCGGVYTKISGPEPTISQPKQKKIKLNDPKMEKGFQTIEEQRAKVKKVEIVPSSDDDSVQILGVIPKGLPPRHLRKESMSSESKPDILTCPVCEKGGFNDASIHDHLDSCIL